MGGKRPSAQKRMERAHAVSRLYLIDMTLTSAGHDRLASFIPGIIEELKELRVATGYYSRHTGEQIDEGTQSPPSDPRDYRGGV